MEMGILLLKVMCKGDDDHVMSKRVRKIIPLIVVPLCMWSGAHCMVEIHHKFVSSI